MATSIQGGTEFHDTQTSNLEHPVARNAQLQSWKVSDLADAGTTTIVTDLAEIDLPAVFLVTGVGQANGITASGFVNVYDSDGSATYLSDVVATSTDANTTTSVAGGTSTTDTDFCLYVSGDTLVLSNECGETADVRVARIA